MPLMSWEEKYAQLTRRVVRLDLEVPRIYGLIKLVEGTQDGMNTRVARRLTNLEALLRQL